MMASDGEGLNELADTNAGAKWDASESTDEASAEPPSARRRTRRSELAAALATTKKGQASSLTVLRLIIALKRFSFNCNT